MGLATHNRGGEVRLGLSAIAASAVLYSAVVLFGVGSASPSALGVGSDRGPSVVLVPQHDGTVTGSEQKLPQATPEPERRAPRARPHGRPPSTAVSAPVAPTSGESAAPTSPRAPAPPKPASAAPPPSASAPLVQLEVELPDPITVPVLPLPELPALLPYPLPISVPDAPASTPLPLP